MKRKRGNIIDYLLRYSLLIALAVVLVLPFLAFALNAFSERWFYPQVIPRYWSLEAWERVVSPRSQMLEAIANSSMIAFCVTILSLLIGLPAARALGLYEFKGKRIIEFLILAPIFVPPITVGMGLSINMLRVGLGGTLIGVILAHLVPVLPYVVFTLSGVFANYDLRYEQQAQTLGAHPLRVLWHITLPMIYPGLIVAGLFAFLISWSQYILTFLIGRGQVMTAPVLLFSTASGGNQAQIAVQAIVFVAPALLVLLLTARYLGGKSSTVSGLSRV